MLFKLLSLGRLVRRQWTRSRPPVTAAVDTHRGNQHACNVCPSALISYGLTKTPATFFPGADSRPLDDASQIQQDLLDTCPSHSLVIPPASKSGQGAPRSRPPRGRSDRTVAGKRTEGTDQGVESEVCAPAEAQSVTREGRPLT